jgi:xanthine dehydrogenase accessory factor
LRFDPPAVLVQIERFEGSSPREAGAWMLVDAKQVLGTIGGGHLEFKAIARARESLSGVIDTLERNALGPSLGQCCGGVVHLRYRSVPSVLSVEAALVEIYSHDTRNQLQVALFGGGHVGRAIVDFMQFLPCKLHWIDSRDEIFPEVKPSVLTEHSDPVERAVPTLAPQSCVLVMSFSHAEDLQIVSACLMRQRERGDLRWLGLIGSKTKWASFRQRLLAMGHTEAELEFVTSPIGLGGKRKEPHAIAAGVAAQLMSL